MYMFYYKSCQHQCSLLCIGLWNGFVPKVATCFITNLINLYWYVVNYLKGRISFLNLTCTFLSPSSCGQMFHWCFVIIARFQMQPSQFFHKTLARDQTAPLQLHSVCTSKTRRSLFSFQVMYVNVWSLYYNYNVLYCSQRNLQILVCSHSVGHSESRRWPTNWDLARETNPLRV